MNRVHVAGIFAVVLSLPAFHVNVAWAQAAGGGGAPAGGAPAGGAVT